MNEPPKQVSPMGIVMLAVLEEAGGPLHKDELFVRVRRFLNTRDILKGTPKALARVQRRRDEADGVRPKKASASS
jgi:hypothetical protein